MFQRLKTAPIYLVIVCISMAVLGISFSAEFIFEIIPCQLCKTQRFLYLALLVTGLMGSFSKIKPKLIKFGIMTILASNALVASYHMGFQEGLFEYRCELPYVGSKDDFIRALNSPGSCSRKWIIAGSSATIWNLSIAIILLIVLACYPDRKNPRLLNQINNSGSYHE